MRLSREFRRPAWQDDLATRVMAAALDSAVAKACWNVALFVSRHIFNDPATPVTARHNDWRLRFKNAVGHLRISRVLWPQLAIYELANEMVCKISRQLPADRSRVNAMHFAQPAGSPIARCKFNDAGVRGRTNGRVLPLGADERSIPVAEMPTPRSANPAGAPAACVAHGAVAA
jgi:hypothetical protein